MDFNGHISKLQTHLQEVVAKIKQGKATAAHSSEIKAGSRASLILNPLFKGLGQYSYAHESLLGLEISPHYIRICQMKNSYGRWSLNQLASSCMENQFTNADIHLNQDLYVENLKTLLNTHHIKTKDVALSVPTSSSIIKIINMPDMDDEDLAQAAAMGAIWEGMVQLSGGISEYSVYYKVLRHKIKASTTLATKEEPSAGSSSLDSLLGGGGEDLSALGTSEISSLGLAEATPLNLPQTEITAQTEAGYVSSLPEPIEPAPVISENITEIAQTPIEEIPAADLPEEEANSMDVLFVATKLTDAVLYMDIAKKAGLEPIIMDVKCNALKHAFETNPEKHHIPKPYALLEFGADENYIYIIENLKVSTFNINISDTDKQLMAGNVDNAEALQGLIQNYATQLYTILDNYAKQNSDKVYNIFVSSNTPLHVDNASSEPMINSFIKQMSEVMGGYKLSPCTFCNHIEVPAEFAKKVNAEGNLSAWAAVLGLATYKLDVFDYNREGLAIDRVNLLPGYLACIKGRAAKVLSTMAMAAVLAVVMFISAASFATLSTHGMSLASEIKSLGQVKGQYEEKNGELQKLSMVMDKVKSLDKVRDTLPSNQMQILTVYKNMTSSIPEGVWLSDVSFTPPLSVEIKGNSINDQKILEFVKKLNDSGGFKKVSLKTMEALDKKDKGSAGVGTGASPVKKFTMLGELGADAGAEKLELLSGGVK